MRVGALNKWVTLSTGPQVEDGPFAPLSPEGIWAAIEPYPPGGSEGRTITHQVRMRFHPQVTVDTRLTYVDDRRSLTRYLYVRGIQDVDEAGDELRLLCEEVQA